MKKVGRKFWKRYEHEQPTPNNLNLLSSLEWWLGDLALNACGKKMKLKESEVNENRRDAGAFGYQCDTATPLFVQERPRLRLSFPDQEYLRKESETENPFCDLRLT